MRNKLISLLASLTLLLTPLQVFADKDGKPNEQAWKNASENAAFNNDDKDKDKQKDTDKDRDGKNGNNKNKDKDKKDD